MYIIYTHMCIHISLYIYIYIYIYTYQLKIPDGGVNKTVLRANVRRGVSFPRWVGVGSAAPGVRGRAADDGERAAPCCFCLSRAFSRAKLPPLLCIYIYIYIYIYTHMYMYMSLTLRSSELRGLSRDGERAAPCSFCSMAFSPEKLVVKTLYGCSIVAEQEHIRKSWTSSVKHPMLRLGQSVTTQPTCSYRTFSIERRLLLRRLRSHLSRSSRGNLGGPKEWGS